MHVPFLPIILPRGPAVTLIRCFAAVLLPLFTATLAAALPTAELAGKDAEAARRILRCDELLVIQQYPVMPSHVYTYHVEGLRPAAACIATGCLKKAARARSRNWSIPARA